MRGKDYPKEKVEWILRHKSDDELRQFFNEIAGQQRKEILSKRLPKKVPGFRPDSEEGIRRRLKMLLQQAIDLKESPSTQRAQICLQVILEKWVHSHPTLQQLLEKYDNDADFPEGGDIRLPNTPLDIACFNYLAQASQSHQLRRSLIQRFYEFGYFQQDDTIELIIKNVPEIPEPSWSKSLQELQHYVFQLEAKFTTLNQSGVEASFAKMREQINNEVSKRLSVLETNYKTLLTTVNTLSTQMDELSQTTLVIKQRLDSTTQNHELADLKQQMEQLEQQLSGDLVSAIDSFQQQKCDTTPKTQFEQLTQQVAKLMADLEAQEELLFESKTIPSSVGSPNGYVLPATGLYTSSLSLLSTLPSPNNLSSIEEVQNQLTTNLKASGLNQGSAKKLANEILAGLRAGELIVFSGPLAFNVVTACIHAITLTKQPPTVIHIPIGLLNGQQFDEYLWNVIRKTKSSGNVCAIILEGINRSALEGYGQTLHQIITQRLLGQTDPAPHIVFFGTLIEGLVALPPPLELCELGPIFDTNMLGWRSQFQPTEYQAGVISSSQWQSWMTEISSESNQNLSEEIFQKSPFCNNPLWQQCVQKARQYLDNQLPSLAFGWLVPRAVAGEVTWQEIKELLLDYVFIGEKGIEDARITKLLSPHLNTDAE
jgi:hypothetical protein